MKYSEPATQESTKNTRKTNQLFIQSVESVDPVLQCFANRAQFRVNKTVAWVAQLCCRAGATLRWKAQGQERQVPTSTSLAKSNVLMVSDSPRIIRHPAPIRLPWVKMSDRLTRSDLFGVHGLWSTSIAIQSDPLPPLALSV